MRALKKRSVVGSQWKLTTNWEQSSKLTLLQLHEKLPKNSVSTILWSFGIWSKLESWKVEKLDKWLFHELPTKEKNSSFWSVPSLILCNGELFIDQVVMYDENWILYNQQQPAQWLDWAEVPKHFPKPNFHQKKCHDHCWVICCWSNPLQLSKSWQNLYIWEVSSANWWEYTKNCNACNKHESTERAQFFSTTTPDHISHNQCFKNWIGLWSFASSAIFTWPHLNQRPLLQASRQLFAGEMLPQPPGGSKCFLRVFWIC